MGTKLAEKTLSVDQLQGLEKADLVMLVVAIQTQMCEMAVEIQRLQDQITKDSYNSDKLLMKKQRTTSLRERAKQASGGQVGDKGHTLKVVSLLDWVVRHEVEQCTHCGMNLSQVNGVEKRQVFEVPPIRMELTDH